MLGLEAASCVLPINFSAFSNNTAVQKIARVKLQARLRGKDFQYSPRGGFVNSGGSLHCFGTGAQNEVMIKSAREFQLLVIAVNSRSDARCLRKIHRGIRDALNLAGRN